MCWFFEAEKGRGESRNASLYAMYPEAWSCDGLSSIAFPFGCFTYNGVCCGTTVFFLVLHEWCVVVLPGKRLVLVRSDTLLPCIVPSLALSAVDLGQ